MMFVIAAHQQLHSDQIPHTNLMHGIYGPHLDHF